MRNPKRREFWFVLANIFSLFCIAKLIALIDVLSERRLLRGKFQFKSILALRESGFQNLLPVLKRQLFWGINLTLKLNCQTHSRLNRKIIKDRPINSRNLKDIKISVWNK